MTSRTSRPSPAVPTADGTIASEHNVPVFGVSELSGALKRTVEETYGRVRVRGEISRPNIAGSGHCYLRIKDDAAVLDGVIWRGAMAKLTLQPEEGLDVIASGRLTTYPGRSSYQIVIDSLELAGEGALLKMLEERRRKLMEEGLFDSERKQPLPYLPAVIGVVTSPTGAVIRDILHRLADRFPRPVLVWPVRVQGEGAAEMVADAIRGFDHIDPNGPIPRPELLIVARGGGSLEDLMAFNEEVVVRAAATCSIPLISAVGHETDTTLLDYVADRRAPTPTGAAEMAVPVRLDLLSRVEELSRRLRDGMTRQLAERADVLTGLARGLPDAPGMLADRIQRLDETTTRLGDSPPRLIQAKTDRLNAIAAALPHPGHVLSLKRSELTAASRSLSRSGTAVIDGLAARLETVARPLGPGLLNGDLRASGQRVSALQDRLISAHTRTMERTQDHLSALSDRLENMSFRRVLERGYAVVRTENGSVISNQQDLSHDQAVIVEMRDGHRRLSVSGDIDELPKAVTNKPRRKSSSANKPKPAAARKPVQASFLDGLE